MPPAETPPALRSRVRAYWAEILLAFFGVAEATGWSIAQPTAAPPSTASSVEFRLGTWNIKKLGHGSSKNYTLVAEIIDESFDVLGLVEVMQKDGGYPGYERLLAELGEDWAGLIVERPRPDDNSGSAEWYAILYRTSIVSPCAGTTGLTYHVDGDPTGSSGVAGQAIDVFSREPAFACLVAGDEGGPTMDFVLGVYHARWDDGSTPAIAAEVDHVDEVFESMAAFVEDERDLILVGDFNLVPSRLAEVVDATDRTIGTGSTLNSYGERTDNLYDHVLVRHADATTEIVADAEVLDPRGRCADADTFERTVSDHLPIVLRVRAETDDD